MAKKLTVDGAIRQAARLWRLEHPGAPVNVSEVCKLAGVNRSNVYERHGKLLGELGVRRERKGRGPSRGRTETQLRTEIKRLEIENNLLRLLWLEEAADPLHNRHPTAVLEDVCEAASLRVAGGRFLRNALLSYLGAGSVKLSLFDSLDADRRQLFIEFLGLRSRPSPPSLEDYEHLLTTLRAG